MNSSATLSQPVGTGDFRTVSESSPRNRFEWIFALGIFLVCLAYLSIPLRYSSLEPDEGIVLQGAERVLHGQVAYRDFFSFYTPGAFYFLALWFRVFGDSFITARISIAVAGALCSVVTYLLTRRVCARGMAVLVAMLATITGTGFRFLVLHNWHSTLLCCLALYAALLFIEEMRPVWAFASALCASLTFLFEQSKGAGLCLGLCLGVLMLRVCGRRVGLGKLALAGIGLGFLGPIFVTFTYFAMHHTASLMVRCWIWPLLHYTQANHVPYGFQNWSEGTFNAIFRIGPWWTRAIKVLAVSPGILIPLLPLIAVGLLPYFVVATLREKAPRNPGYYILVCSTVTGLLISVVMTRADILHFMYLAPLLYVVLAWVLQTPDFSSRLLAYSRPYLIAYTGTAFGLLGMAILLTATGSRNRIETRRGVIITSGKDSVIEYVQHHVTPAGNLLVYPYLPLYSYLTATVSPSRYDYFQPGMNTQSQAQEIVASLSDHKGPVLFEPWFTEKIANSWPGTSLSAIARDAVADYVARNYRVCQILSSPGGGRFDYMIQKGEPCPSGKD